MAVGDDGKVIGTVTTTSYGTALAWIGMMLVHPERRRQGIATALMDQAISYLQSTGVECIKLDATPTGKAVYERLGFQSEWMFHRWQGNGLATDESSWQVSAEAVEIPSSDLTAFGCDRTQWLQKVGNDSLVVSRADGFGMARKGAAATYLGPVMATDERAATQILSSLLRCICGPVYWDIPAPNEDALLTATAFGFQPVRELTRMELGTPLGGCRVDWQYAICDPGTG